MFRLTATAVSLLTVDAATTCPAGTYSDASACVICPIGTTSASSTATTAAVSYCESLAPGYYGTQGTASGTSGAHATGVTACVAGSTGPGSATTTTSGTGCTMVAAGYAGTIVVTSGSSAITATKCAVTGTTSAASSTSPVVCNMCAAGYYCTFPGSSATITTANKCTAGSWTPAVAYASAATGASTDCYLIAAGYFGSIGTKTATPVTPGAANTAAVGTLCPLGTTSLVSTELVDTTKNSCKYIAAGYYGTVTVGTDALATNVAACATGTSSISLVTTTTCAGSTTSSAFTAAFSIFASMLILISQ